MESKVVTASLIMGILASCAHSTRSAEEWITVERGPCFGFCPVYEISLANSGTVTFQGIRHTAFVGTKQVQVSPDTAETVKSKLAPYKPIDSQDEFACVEAASDQPTFTVRWHQEGASRTLHFDAGCNSQDAQQLRSILEDLPSNLQLEDEAKQTTRPGVSRG